jgi:hypothetical protein
VTDEYLVPDRRCHHGIAIRFSCPKCQILAIPHLERNPMAYLPPHDLDQLHAETITQVQDTLDTRGQTVAGHAVVGAFPISPDMIFAVTKGVIEAAAKSYGDMFVDLVLTQKPLITKVLGDASLAALDKLIHGLQGVS